jgi:thiamine-phosphate diphosphorylase
MQAIALCKGKNIPLYINDNWQLAIEFDAYGIHLGQEDLAELSRKDLSRIHSHGLRLGISCHNETELAYAHGLSPSYLAFGPVFSPKSKVVDHSPLGLEKLQEWQSSYGKLYPTTCIGGIEAEHLTLIANTGMTSIAAISALSSRNSSEGDSPNFINHFKQCFSPD